MLAVTLAAIVACVSVGTWCCGGGLHHWLTFCFWCVIAALVFSRLLDLVIGVIISRLKPTDFKIIWDGQNPLFTGEVPNGNHEDLLSRFTVLVLHVLRATLSFTLFSMALLLWAAAPVVVLENSTSWWETVSLSQTVCVGVIAWILGCLLILEPNRSPTTNYRLPK